MTRSQTAGFMSSGGIQRGSTVPKPAWLSQLGSCEKCGICEAVLSRCCPRNPAFHDRRDLRRDTSRRVLPGECPFDSRDDVYDGEYPANFENSLDDRCSPQDDAELTIALKGVLPRLHEYADSRRVDELGR